MKENEREEQDTLIEGRTVEKSQLVDASLVAPVSIPMTQQPGEVHFVPAPARGKNLDGTPRKKTFGENLFDLSIYGGIGWIANEFLSGIIYDRSAYKNQPLHKIYNAGYNALQPIGKLFKLHPEKWAQWTRRPFDIFVMTLGGNLLVWPMKWAEDNKGDLVRTANYGIGGKKGDPELERAHDEMDAAPKQSWGTLIQSRIGTLAGAIGIDYAFGANDAFSTKIFQTEGSKKWASLNNINTSIFRKLGKFAEKHWNYDPGATEKINFAEKHSPFDIVSQKMLDNLADDHTLKQLNVQAEGKIANFGKSYGFIFLLSGVLAGIFYINSRIFAHNRDKKQHHMEEHEATGTKHIGLDASSAHASADQLEHTQEKPKHKIHKPQAHERLAHTTQEAVSIG